MDADGGPLAFPRSSDAPRGMTIDPKTGTIHWRPGPTDVATEGCTVIVNDGDGGMIRQGVSGAAGTR